jgi:hypothetical protein
VGQFATKWGQRLLRLCFRKFFVESFRFRKLFGTPANLALQLQGGGSQDCKRWVTPST